MLSFPGAALAADSVPPETQPVVTDEIVVTAQKRVEDRRDVPIPITTFTGESLERLHARTYRDLSYYTPGFYAEAESPGHPYVAIRGISTDLADIASEPRVAIFRDGVSSSRLQGSLSELFDIQRIEIARGPQSTLFGRSALIGGVNIITNHADPSKSSYSALAEFGNLDERRFDIVGNAALGNGSAARVAARYRHQDGYVKNLGDGPDFNGIETYAGRASLHFEPADPLVVDLIADYEHDRSTGASYKSGSFYPSDPATGAVLGDLRPWHGATLAPAPGYQLGEHMGGARALTGATALVQYALSDSTSLVSTSGYRSFRLHDVQDQDGTSLDLLSAGEKSKGEQLSQELRLSYDGGAFRAFAGAGLFHENLVRTIPFQIDEREALFLLFGGLDRTNPTLLPESVYTSPTNVAALLQGAVASVGGSLPALQALAIANNLLADHQEQYTNRDKVTAVDFFADATFDVTPRLQLQAGARFTSDNREARFSSAVAERSVLAGVLAALQMPAAQRAQLLGALSVPGAAFIPQSAAYPLPIFGISAQPSGAEGVRKLKDSGPAWRLNARYALSDQANLYLSYARGRRPEVTSAAAPTAPGGLPVFTDLSDETVDDFEGGVKLRTSDGKLSFEADTYLYLYRNFQTQALSNARVISIDAGRARAYGLEGELRWRPQSWVELFGTYAFNHARFTSGAYDGNRFRLNPDHSASLGATLRTATGAGMIEATPTLTYRSRIFFDDTNGDPALLAGAVLLPINYHPSQAGYVLANLQLAFGPADRRWQIEAFVQNAFDRKYLRDSGQGSLAFGLPTYIAAPPRTFGMAFSIKG